MEETGGRASLRTLTVSSRPSSVTLSFILSFFPLCLLSFVVALLSFREELGLFSEKELRGDLDKDTWRRVLAI